jgi:Na+/H+ antiporter NhaD/arsenite permease-like protein
MEAVQIFTAAVASLTLLGVALGRLPALKMNRATIALVGATLLVAGGVLSLDQAYRAVDWNTLLLLFGMMVLNVNLRAGGFFQRVTAGVIRFAKTPRRLLALIIGASGVLSAVFLNDTIVLVFAPLVLDVTLALRRNPLPLLVGLSSGISFVDFTEALAPIAVVGLAIAWGVLVLVYRREFTGSPLGTVVEVPISGDHRTLIKALVATGVMGVALVAGLPVPLAAALAAALLLVTRRTAPEGVFQEIDWGLLVFFIGLFVVTGALEASGLSGQLLQLLHPYANGGPLPLSAVSVVLSNVVSNVPAVMLLRPVVPTLNDPASAWLTIAMATTLAGNLTLIGSVANLIVAEIARRRGVELSFGEYLKAGTAIAILSLGVGILWLSL